MIKNTDEIENEIGKEKRWIIKNGDELLSEDLPETKFLVEKLFPEEGLNLVCGNPGAFKTWLLLVLARDVSIGEPLMGRFKTDKQKVLYVDEESNLKKIRDRWRKIKGDKPTDVDFLSMAGFQIDQEQDKESLLALAKERGYGVVIFDSLRDIHSSDENNSKDAQLVSANLLDFCKAGITVLVAHHNRKNIAGNYQMKPTFRGSSVYKAKASSILMLDVIKDDPEAPEVLIFHDKLREDRKINDFKVGVFEKNGKIGFQFLESMESETTKLAKTKEAIKELLTRKDSYQQQIVDELLPLFFSERTIRRALKEMFEAKEIRKISGQAEKQKPDGGIKIIRVQFYQLV